MYEIFTAQILTKYNIQYYWCETCGFLQTEEPFWLEEAYASPINITDTGLVQRNISLSKKISILLYNIFDSESLFLDYAGGYGLFTRLMRDIGFNYYWTDPYTENIFSKGFEYKTCYQIEGVTLLETLEHFLDPLVELEKVINISKNIIFTTQMLKRTIPSPKNWWYYGLEHGQHISFYSIHTLKAIAKKFNLNFNTDGYIHMFSTKNINPFVYSSILKLDKFGYLTDITKRMKSKTQEDHNQLKDKLNLNNN